jgi:hypothetical protein
MAGIGPSLVEATTGLVLHVFDEVVHHAAEVALLRDLYLHRFRVEPG